MSRIALWWPGKKIPDWFQSIRQVNENDPPPSRWEHRGYGIILKFRGQYHAWALNGKCIFIENAHDVKIIGGGNGVIFHQLIGKPVLFDKSKVDVKILGVSKNGSLSYLISSKSEANVA